eukprot:tig00001234_g7743.t1
MDKLDTTWVIRTSSKTAEYTGDVGADGQITGHGLYVNAEGDLYGGDFKSNRFSGSGAYRFSDSSVYKGEFVDGKYHGKGCFKASDGSYYDGSWKDGVRHGAGSLMFVANKMRILFEGEWKNDKMEGTFKETRHYPQNKAVRTWTCLFKNNKFESRKLLTGPTPDDNPPSSQIAQVDPTKWAFRSPNESVGIFQGEEEPLEVVMRPKQRLVPLVLSRDSNASSASSSSGADSMSSAHSTCSSPRESLVPADVCEEIVNDVWPRCKGAGKKYKRHEFVEAVVACQRDLLARGTICSEDCLVACLKDWDAESGGKRSIANQKIAAGYVTALVERHIIGPFPSVAAKRPRTRRSKQLCAVCGK